MNEREETQKKHQEESLKQLEAFWRLPLSPSFRTLYTHLPEPFLAPCEFYPIRLIVQGAGRSFGGLPQFLPFGRVVGEGGFYGFYATSETAQGSLPVVYWDEDEMFMRPIASSFEAFMRHCLLVGRYEVEEWGETGGEWQEEAEMRELLHLLNLPSNLLEEPLPRNETELHERIVKFDPQNATSLCHLGCLSRARGNLEHALDFYYRASEAVSWMGDCPYLVADIYREKNLPERAIQYYWSVVQQSLPLCTRTMNWDLGEDHPEADIYEVAADMLIQLGKFASEEMKAHPLWIAVTQEDPYDPDVRESLANHFYEQNDLLSAEREYLNALSLCYAERGNQPLRLYDALTRLYERMGQIRDVGLVRHDRLLPRTLL